MKPKTLIRPTYYFTQLMNPTRQEKSTYFLPLVPKRFAVPHLSSAEARPDPRLETLATAL